MIAEAGIENPIGSKMTFEDIYRENSTCRNYARNLCDAGCHQGLLPQNRENDWNETGGRYFNLKNCAPISGHVERGFGRKMDDKRLFQVWCEQSCQ